MTEGESVSLITVPEIAGATSGMEIMPPGGGRAITNVVIDSRLALKGSLFVPLPGEHTNGHRFIADAIERGATCLLVETREWEKLDPGAASLIDELEVPVVLVEDTLVALQKCAAFHIEKHRNAIRIGITGSSGKTTTKELIGAICSRSGPTFMNEGNLNSEIGLPLSAFGLSSGHKYAVFEMGINHPGEMDVLSDIVRPDYALITNIGSAHIGLLGSKEAIALEKKRIFKNFSGAGAGYVFEDEEHFALLTEGVHGKIIPYGEKSTKGYKGYTDLGLDGIAIDWEGLRVRYPLFGYHNLLNALAAISVSFDLGIDKHAIASGLESARPLFGRSEIMRGPVTVIRDCYNANPDSVTELLRFFRELNWKGRKIAVLGSMLELGGESERAHGKIAGSAMDFGFDAVFFFGDEYKNACDAHSAGRWKWTSDFDTLSKEVADYVSDGDIVLIKASRGMALERIASMIVRGFSS